MDTSARDCLVLFDTRVEARLEEGWQSGVLRQRTRTVKAGPMVYMDCYPVWDTQTARAPILSKREMEMLDAKD